MNTITEQIEDIKKEIRETPYNKSTEHHIGKLRAKIARLKDREIEHSSKKGGGMGGYAVKKQGDATVVLVGPPSSGKSTLLNSLTNAQSKVAPYAFTTVSVIPGMMEYKKARIQILDVPGLIEGAEEGKGRGKEVLSVVRGCDLIVFMTDFERIHVFKKLVDALERNGIRINKEKPNIKVDKRLNGGLQVFSNIRQDFSKETVKEIVSEMGIKNGDVTIKEKITLDDLIDSLSRNRVYIPAIFAVNKLDLNENKENTKNVYDLENTIYISAQEGMGIEEFKNKLWVKLKFITIYLVKPDEEVNNNNPIVVKEGLSLKEILKELGTNFQERTQKAVIWGPGSKFPGQEVSLSTIAKDGMQVRYL